MKLQLSRPLASLDLETTGPFPGVDRIVDIGIVTLFPDGHTEEWQTLINPGIPIPSSATAIHGITDEMVKDAPTLSDVAAEIHDRLDGCDLTGFNAKRFDVPFLKADLARVGKPFVAAPEPVIVDAMTIYHHFFPRDLPRAMFDYNIGLHENAHRALPDAMGALKVLMVQAEHHAELPTTPAAIADFVRDPDAIDEDGKFKFYGDDVRITIGDYAGHTLQWMVKNQPGFLRWMLTKNFAEDSKAVARNALAGVMPKKRETKP